MKKRKFRMTPFLLAFCILLGIAPLPARAANPGGVEFLNTHVNTGNQREDIIAVALTQMGYKEIVENDTKYGDWMGYPFQPWCATFVSWCARQADISQDVLKNSPRARPEIYDITCYPGTDYTPQPGDLFFTEGFTHVGLVWYVEGDFFYSIEGNAKYHDYRVPDDEDVDSFDVMSNRRLISAHSFGVPAYEGGGKDHNYIKKTESAHPHKTYYQCSDCGDRHDTGYNACKAGCAKCLTCGCVSSGAGYYLVSTKNGPLKLRPGHKADNGYAGYVSDGAVVYVHGFHSASGWAYVEYDGVRGHIQSKNLKKYHNAPASPQLSGKKAEYTILDAVTVTWNSPANTEQYRLKLFRDGALYKEQIMDLARTITLEKLPAGRYEVQVIACNRTGASAPGTLGFTVRDSYTLSYDTGDAAAPAAQTQPIGGVFTVTDAAPFRAGYTFLGWTAEPRGMFVQYTAGDTISADADRTLYAVWKRDDAALAAMSIARMPGRTFYLKGEELDTTGLALELTYSDGSGHIVTDGFTAEGFDSETYGTKTVTVGYGTMTVTYEVQVGPWIPGDMDLNKAVNRDDVMQLLWHISFPDQFPITVPADFNSDGAVNRDDVMQLLWHISFPDQFPLAVEWPDSPEAEEGGE